MAAEIDPPELYRRLPWPDIAIASLAEGSNADTVAITHRLVVDASKGAATVADALSRLGAAIGEIYNGLDADDGRALGDEWRALLADLAYCPRRRGPGGWLATASQRPTGGLWAPSSAFAGWSTPWSVAPA